MDRGLRVSVVGGSIAGCATAGALLDAGHRVSVHERARGPLRDHGVAILTPAMVVDRLIEQRLLGPDAIRTSMNGVRYVHRASAQDGDTVWIGDVLVPMSAFSWSRLQTDLRSLVPDANYHTGQDVTVTPEGQFVGGDGELQDADLVVFADGHASVARQVLDPDVRSVHQDLVLWRGLVAETEVDVGALEGVVTRIPYAGGHGVAYLVPGPGGAGVGDRQVLWGFYIPLGGADVGRVLTDRDGHRHRSSVPLGRVDDDVARSLREQLRLSVPDRFLDLVDRSGASTIQAITETVPRTSFSGRVCLVGDAAAVFPPYSASGVLKAVEDAVALRESLRDAVDVPAALAERDAARRTAADRTRSLAHGFRRSLVDEVPDFSAMRVEDKGRWLAGVHEGARLELPDGRTGSPVERVDGDRPVGPKPR